MLCCHASISVCSKNKPVLWDLHTLNVNIICLANIKLQKICNINNLVQPILN